MEYGDSLVVTYNPVFRNLNTTLRTNFNIFTQMHSLEQFLCQVHVLTTEGLETSRIYWEGKKFVN